MGIMKRRDWYLFLCLLVTELVPVAIDLHASFYLYRRVPVTEVLR